MIILFLKLYYYLQQLDKRNYAYSAYGHLYFNSLKKRFWLNCLYTHKYKKLRAIRAIDYRKKTRQIYANSFLPAINSQNSLTHKRGLVGHVSGVLHTVWSENGKPKAVEYFTAYIYTYNQTCKIFYALWLFRQVGICFWLTSAHYRTGFLSCLILVLFGDFSLRKKAVTFAPKVYLLRCVRTLRLVATLRHIPIGTQILKRLYERRISSPTGKTLFSLRLLLPTYFRFPYLASIPSPYCPPIPFPRIKFRYSS